MLILIVGGTLIIPTLQKRSVRGTDQFSCEHRSGNLGPALLLTARVRLWGVSVPGLGHACA